MRKHPVHPPVAPDPTPALEEGPCAICHARPAEVYGLVCGPCKDAIDADEPWTHAHADVIERLIALEAEEERSASPTGQG